MISIKQETTCFQVRRAILYHDVSTLACRKAIRRRFPCCFQSKISDTTIAITVHDFARRTHLLRSCYTYREKLKQSNCKLNQPLSCFKMPHPGFPRCVEHPTRSDVSPLRLGDKEENRAVFKIDTTLSQEWSGNRIRGPQCAFEMSMFMCPAVHKLTRNQLRSSSTHEPSDPPFRVIFLISFNALRRANVNSIKWQLF